MKVIVGAGGTGGHLYPALALVEYIKEVEPDSEFLFVGTKDRIESEVVPQQGYEYIGLTNKILIKNVDKIVCCYDKAYENFPKDKTYKLGNPRASVIASIKPDDIFKKYHLNKNLPLVTIVMGSLGSKSVNEMMLKSLKTFEQKNYQVLYVTGKPYFEEMKTKLGKLNKNIKLVPYIDDMPSVLKNTTLVVSRAGASTLAEITAVGIPAILIPSPYVAANHQEYNARELADRNAAMMILEENLNSKDFVEKVDYILENKIVQESMQKSAKALGKPNACRDIYKLIKEM